MRAQNGRNVVVSGRRHKLPLLRCRPVGDEGNVNRGRIAVSRPAGPPILSARRSKSKRLRRTELGHRSETLPSDDVRLIFREDPVEDVLCSHQFFYGATIPPIPLEITEEKRNLDCGLFF